MKTTSAQPLRTALQRQSRLPSVFAPLEMENEQGLHLTVVFLPPSVWIETLPSAAASW